MSEIALIGKKIGMTREFYKTGQLVPVTVLKMEKARVIQIIDKEKDEINAGDPLTNDPNVGGFGQLDAEVVLQSPYRIFGLIAFFIGVGLTQILLVL